ncbi:NADH-ubiquinone oxidoreductase chain L [Caenispirillum salinarum AK4]|uniref:NADH-ubiquinone oxidoreductase chain L n=1 Tax=Caenispirillum salinarum AK4 TaxID=1238182 RepID=K9HKK2_9PROT|nr:monovalent cation/H+ antiporter subunit D family protein [Caenispirillum salinarum]EKV30908.1 NADH-ubiquinone oxidoreductase chain L [Caenispirillum salinarum AK4]
MNPLLWMLVTPLIGGVGILLANRQPNAREGVTILTAAALIWQVWGLAPEVLAGGRPEASFFEIVPGIELAFRVEPLGMLFALVASGLWIIASAYSIGYMRGNHEKHQTRFYLFFAVSIAATIGVAFSANLFTLFVFYEALTLATYPLVTHAGSAKARQGGRTYLGILIATSIGLLLTAIIWTWWATGTTEFTPGGILGQEIVGPEVGLLLFLFMFGIGKAALMPIHRWLPAAMVAPTPVSALLHAVAVVKAGVFSVIKVIVYVFGWENLAATPSAEWLLYVAGGTIVVASLIAMRQDNLKRRLAYSTVSQLSYVTMAAAILAPLSLVGAALHIAAHALGKITLFFAAGAIHTAAHKDYVSQLDGIGRRMPWTMGAFAVGALSMIGVPPTAGFISKWYMLLGAYDVQAWFAVGVITLSTLLNAAYFLPIVYAAFFKPEKPVHADGHAHTHHNHDYSNHGEAPWPSVVALTLTAAGTVALFFFAEMPLDLARQMIEATP